MTNQPSHHLTVDVNKLPTEICSCGSSFWKRALLLKRASGILVGKPNDELLFIDIIVCDDCNKPHPSVKIKLPFQQECEIKILPNRE